jgi:hypothetical protein
MMKRIQTLISVSAVAAVTALPVFADRATPEYRTTRMGDETATDIAQRVGTCGEAGFTAADFESDSLIRVTCSGLDGGLRTGAAIGGAMAAIALIGLASDGSGSTTTTTTTTTTTGTTP